MSFVQDSILQGLGELAPEAADEFEFGVIRLDDDGNVTLYNRYESELANVPRDAALGANFFTEIALCTDHRYFSKVFFDGLENGKLDEEFDYVFTYRMRPTPVRVRLYRDPESETNWVFVKSDPRRLNSKLRPILWTS